MKGTSIFSPIELEIPNMSKSKLGRPTLGKCHEVLKVIIIFISIFVIYNFMQTF
jgi:hypothetical protein